MPEFSSDDVVNPSSSGNEFSLDDIGDPVAPAATAAAANTTSFLERAFTPQFRQSIGDWWNKGPESQEAYMQRHGRPPIQGQVSPEAAAALGNVASALKLPEFWQWAHTQK